MTELTLETLRAELAPMHAQLAELAPMRAQLAELAPMRAQIAGVEASLVGLDARVSGLDAKVASMRAQLESLPMIGRAITVLQQETRSLRAAFNDFARTNVTAGEIEALHADVNRVQAENFELQTRLATVERILEELQERGGGS